jgi:hypothetical protein
MSGCAGSKELAQPALEIAFTWFGFHVISVFSNGSGPAGRHHQAVVGFVGTYFEGDVRVAQRANGC